MKMIALAMFATTALVPAAYAQGQAGQASPGRTQAQQAQTNQGQLRPMAVSQLKGEQVYSQRGQEIGEIERVMLGQNNQSFVVVSFGEFLGLGGEQRMIPLSRIAYRGDRLIVQNMGDNEFRNLQTYRADMAGFEEAEDAAQARILVLAAAGQQGQQQAQDGSRIFVQQSAPTVRVDPADPRVVVRQAQPQVTVNQAQPEIIVRQPQPTVRVDIPQPEIIVRMPEPDVNVAMAQPQVQVSQPRPQVQVQQPQQQPQVQVEPSQPRVLVQRQAGEQAQVQVQRAEGQPQVRYERAEPRVIVNQAEGQPNVRIERQQQAQATQQQRPAQMNQQQTAQGSVYSAEQRRTIRERLNAGDVEATGAIDANVQTRPIAISDIEDTNVVNARGEELGEVDRVIVTPQGRQFLVVGSGGFLGIGRDRVAFPLERFWLRGDRLVIRGVTEQDIEAMDDYRDTVDSFQRMSRADQADLRVWE
jgi:sporulation protein YlmC with PRC-barrel domain